MIPAFSIPIVRKIFSGVLILAVVVLVGFLTYLYVSLNNVLIGTPRTDTSKVLLTNFNISKFDTAIERLEKRRGLADPDLELQNPFGTQPRR